TIMRTTSATMIAIRRGEDEGEDLNRSANHRRTCSSSCGGPPLSGARLPGGLSKAIIVLPAKARSFREKDLVYKSFLCRTSKMYANTTRRLAISRINQTPESGKKTR